MKRSVRALCRGALVTCFVMIGLNTTVWAETAKGADGSARSAFREPVVLASKGGLLEVELTAHQGEATLDTVATPVQNFLVFSYKLVHGTASDGKREDDNLYPAPTLKVDPASGWSCISAIPSPD